MRPMILNPENWLASESVLD